MLRRITLMGAVAMTSVSFFPVSAQIAVDKAVVAKLNAPIDSARQMRPNQLYFAQVVLSEDPNLPVGVILGVQISGGGLHAAAARTPNGILHFSSPAATASAPTASGDTISLAAGDYICFNVHGACRTSGSTTGATNSPSTAKSTSAAATLSPTGATTSNQYPFTLEGIGLRMSLDQLRAAAKAAGSVKGLQKQGPTTYNLDTRDLSFQIELTNAGQLRQYNVSDRNPRHLKETMTSGPLYDKLVKAFGPKSTWSSNVLYDLGEGGGAYAIITDQETQ